MKTKQKSNIAGVALKFTLYIVLFLVSLAIYIGAGVIVFGWDWTLLYDLGFWVRSILLATANLIIGITTVSFVFDLLELKETEYNELETAIKGEATQLLGHKLTHDVIKINWHNKRKAWVSLIEVKLENLISRLSHKVAEEIELHKEEDYSRKAKRYLRRKAKYEEQLTEEWINSYLHYQDIDYEEVTQTEIIYGIKVFKPKKSLLDRNILRKALITKLGSGLFFGVLSTLGAFIVPVDYLSYTTFYIMLGINLIALLSNMGFSIFKAYSSHDKRLNNAVIRLELLKNHKSGFYNTYEEVPLKKFERKVYEKKVVEVPVEQPEEVPVEQPEEVYIEIPTEEKIIAPERPNELLLVNEESKQEVKEDIRVGYDLNRMTNNSPDLEENKEELNAEQLSLDLGI